MNKCLISIFLIVMILMLSACTQATAGEQATVSAAADFSGTDFKGTWCVSEILAPNGKPANADDMQQLGADFKLELLKDGVYFVYAANGSVLGQGQYSVSGNTLTCAAGSGSTVYQIIDANTLKGVYDDKSVTMMSRQPEPSPTATEGDADVPDDQDAPEDITDDNSDDQDAPDDIEEPDTSSPDVSDTTQS